jgi:quinol-cytochrome oxidoreductase complex cytochrome b subunit
MISNHVLLYPTPINFSYAYSFGSLVGLIFALQIITGIFLAMHYTAHTELAFSSVVHIMTDVKNGYLIRYLHANGASMVFILLYIHIGRGLYFRSYIYTRRYLWWSGIVIFLLMIITAFIGYVLPWGQMSFWGATVITSLVTAVPFVGETIAHWIWGGFSVNNATLIRFYSLHYLLPFVITGVIFVHLILLHTATSTNPTQINAYNKIPFHPYFTYKDVFALTGIFFLFIILIHFYPNILGHSDNFIPANPLVTPPHIVPEWYFTPFYAILRSCPNKLGGVIFMLAAILILFLIPFYKLPINTIVGPLSFLHKIAFWIFCAIFFILLFLGGKPATAPYVGASQLFTFLYFLYFLLIIPIIPLLERALITEYQQNYLTTNKKTNSEETPTLSNYSYFFIFDYLILTLSKKLKS